MSGAAAMLLALVLDALFGWPQRLHARIGHPVMWMGALIEALDARLNRPDWSPRARRLAGSTAALVMIGVTVLGTAVIAALLPAGAAGVVLTGVLAWPLVAARSLHEHVAAVAQPLGDGDLSGARLAVSRIVGRDPARLDEAGIARATLESLAENASDGVVAPLFWGAVLGLPGIAAYKALNTLDSMIGHRTPRYEAFGWASARLDDAANLIPARLTGLLLSLVSPRRGEALAVMRRDARHHRSPNAGWPEAAMAGALGVRLSGPRVYGDHVAEEPWVNAGATDPEAEDLDGGLALYRRAMFWLAATLVLLAAL